MHHTDYSTILRCAHRKTLKNSRQEAQQRAGSQDSNVATGVADKIAAIIAIILVLICLIHMDPANADIRSGAVCSSFAQN